MINVLFSAQPPTWDDYEHPLKQAFAEAGLQVNLSRSHAPDQTDYIAQAKYTLSTLTDTHWALKVEVLKFLLPFLYLFLPLVFFTVIGWSGWKAFAALSVAMGTLLGPAQKAGRTGADVGKARSGI